jgi:hypothetical protein
LSVSVKAGVTDPLVLFATILGSCDSALVVVLLRVWMILSGDECGINVVLSLVAAQAVS